MRDKERDRRGIPEEQKKRSAIEIESNLPERNNSNNNPEFCENFWEKKNARKI